MAMMAMTTSNSISAKPPLALNGRDGGKDLFLFIGSIRRPWGMTHCSPRPPLCQFVPVTLFELDIFRTWSKNKAIIPGRASARWFFDREKNYSLYETRLRNKHR